jgi:hypothetical protein
MLLIVKTHEALYTSHSTTGILENQVLSADATDIPLYLSHLDSLERIAFSQRKHQMSFRLYEMSRWTLST